ncbi:hypothetical protein [Luteolibacter soli]|uniref:Uncharacterized protein n=1 Tax=Luteolibacter soli TaxID=3135280 RepID=A0ABU9AWI1_9BACT
MIECLPRGICSWNYELSCAGHGAQTELRWMGEQGSLWVDGESFNVVKEGLWSGRWRLEGNAGTLFVAQKVSAFRRTFEIDGRGGQAVLRAESAFGRSMLLEGERVNVAIRPAHVFTRRASIQGEVGDFRLVAFGFWLTALLWRRAASNNNSGGGGS